MVFGAKVTLCRGRAISEVCVCDFRLSLHVLSHMAVSVFYPSLLFASYVRLSVCLPSHIFMHFLSGHFYARTRFPLDINGCHFRSLASSSSSKLFDFRQ